MFFLVDWFPVSLTALGFDDQRHSSVQEPQDIRPDTIFPFRATCAVAQETAEFLERFFKLIAR